MNMLLNSDEVAALTGCFGGTKGKTRSSRQIAQLKKMKIPHYINAADRPIVVRAMIEGGISANVPAITAWEPGV